MKGIILAAGYGTRFLPITKTIPKEMLPILNKPSIEYIVEEFIESGIKEIIIITSKRKKTIEDYFDKDFELETVFLKKNRLDLFKKINKYDMNISFIRQKEMLGTGHALLQAKPWIGQEPVIVAYPDDIIIGKTPLASKLIKIYKKTGKNVLSVIENPKNINRYGILELYEDNFHVKNIIEKPKNVKESNNKASIGRFLYTYDFFKYLEEGFKKHDTGEYFHTYALKKLMDKKKVIYKTVKKNERLDIGEIEGYIKAIIKVAKKDNKLLKLIIDALKK